MVFTVVSPSGNSHKPPSKQPSWLASRLSRIFSLPGSPQALAPTAFDRIKSLQAQLYCHCGELSAISNSHVDEQDLLHNVRPPDQTPVLLYSPTKSNLLSNLRASWISQSQLRRISFHTHDFCTSSC